MNQVFTNPSKEEVTNPKIYPLTVKEFVETYNAHAKLKHFFKCNATLDEGLELQIIDNKNCTCNKDGSLYQCHCNGMQQHPRHTCLKKTIKAEIHGKGMKLPSYPNAVTKVMPSE